jgi:rhamnosyltransferase
MFIWIPGGVLCIGVILITGARSVDDFAGGDRALSRCSKKNIAAVVILYQPSPDVEANVNSWADQVDLVLLIDNSEGDEPSPVVAEIASRGNSILMRNGSNEGVARALNIAADTAAARGYKFLLTMDQDSRAEPDMVSHMVACMEKDWQGPVGLVSPRYLDGVRPVPDALEACCEVMIPLTSGSLLNLGAYGVAGPFRDDFFIDFVDNEYCLRLRKHAQKVVRANKAFLHHRVGDARCIGPFVVTHHSPLRRYYKTRNRCAVFAEYFSSFPGHCLFDLLRLAKEMVFILCFESQKVSKFVMMWRGWRDFRRGKFGKYDHGRD